MVSGVKNISPRPVDYHNVLLTVTRQGSHFSYRPSNFAYSAVGVIKALRHLGSSATFETR